LADRPKATAKDKGKRQVGTAFGWLGGLGVLVVQPLACWATGKKMGNGGVTPKRHRHLSESVER